MLVTPDAGARGIRLAAGGETIELVVAGGRATDHPPAHVAGSVRKVPADHVLDGSRGDFLEVGSDCRLRVLCRICTG